MLLKINHETRYVYDAPVQYGLQQVRLRPKERRGQAVKSWNLEVEHRHANRNGAPGLFGFSPQSQKSVYIDHIRVYPNE